MVTLQDKWPNYAFIRVHGHTNRMKSNKVKEPNVLLYIIKVR